MYDLINRLREKNIKIKVVGDQLSLSMPENIDVPDIIAEVKLRKQALIDFLKEFQDMPVTHVIQACESGEYYPLSSAQRRLYFLYQFDKTSLAYNMPFMVRIEGDLDKGRLLKSINEIINRHESFRTSFVLNGDEPVQAIAGKLEFKINELDASSNNIDTLFKDFILPFNLSKGPLLRMSLLRLGERIHVLMVDLHHIISDRVSQQVLIKDFGTLYNGQDPKPLKLQYKDYAVWQQSSERKEVLEKQRQFWLGVYAEKPSPLELPLDFPRSSDDNQNAGTVSILISKEETSRLRNLTQQQGATMFMSLLAIFKILLSKLSGQEDIIVGTPVVGREHPDLDNIIGMFVNTLALRNRLNGELSFSEFLSGLRSNTLSSFENQSYPYEDLLNDIKVERNARRNPLFDIMFSYYRIEEQPVEATGLKMEWVENSFIAPKFDITFYATEGTDEIEITIVYLARLLKKETIERCTWYFKNILSAIVANRDIKLKEIDILSEKERHQLLVDFNNTRKEYPLHRFIHHLFEEQVKRSPNNIAVVEGARNISYGKLDGRANSLAALIRKRRVDAYQPVAILLDSSIEMIVGMIGALKAGAAFLPIDPQYPKERINYILKDSGAGMILSKPMYTNQLDYQGAVIDLSNSDAYDEQYINSDIAFDSSHLACLIYSTDSTGDPKGVMVTHRSLVNLCYWHNEHFQVTEADHATKYAGDGVDTSVWEIFPYLLTGACIHIIDKEIRLNVQKLNDYFEANKITLTFLPTQFLEQFNLLENRSLRIMLTAGNKLRKVSNTRYNIFNNYGPTEGTVVTTSCQVSKDADNIPIGKPVANAEVFIFDKFNKLTPVGVTGELWLSGEGLAKGYFNNPSLTQEKFVHNPLSPGKLMYRTGDLARWLPDGTIEFLGRVDDQVKIRGFRVELGKIETKLLTLDRIQAATVQVKDILGESHLVAYCVAARPLDNLELKSHLRRELPEYMIPDYYVWLHQLPVTPNGKIDKSRLPDPVLADEKKLHSPRTQVERELTKIWSNLLGIDSSRIDIHKSFFELGGHSLKTTALSLAIYKIFGVEISLVDIFNDPTISGLAEKIGGKSETYYQSDLVTLLKRDINTEHNLFLIHDGSGDVHAYVSLANAIEKCNVWGIRSFFLEQVSPQNKPIEEVAMEYVNSIRQKQPEGPYMIGGWSLGGSIAYEVSRQFERQGATVSLVIMVDTSFGYSKEVGEVLTADKEKDLIKSLLTHDYFEAIDNCHSIEQVWATMVDILKDDKELFEKIKSMPGPDMVKMIPNIEHLSPPVFISYANTIRSLQNAMSNYVFTDKVNAPILYFKASESQVNTSVLVNHTCQDATVQEVQGDHFSVLQLPHVATIAQHLQERLDLCIKESVGVDA